MPKHKNMPNRHIKDGRGYNFSHFLFQKTPKLYFKTYLSNDFWITSLMNENKLAVSTKYVLKE